MKRILTKNQMKVNLAVMFLFSTIATFSPFGVCFGGKEMGPQMKNVKLSLPKADPKRELGAEKILPEDKQSVGVLSKQPTIQTPEQEKNPVEKLGLKRSKITVAQAQSGQNQTSVPPGTMGKDEIQKERLELTLDQAITIALEHNLGLQIQGYVRDSTQTTISQAQAAFHPTVGATITATGTDTQKSTQGAPVVTTETQTVTGFINQPLPTGTGASLNVTGTFMRTHPGDNPGVNSYTGGVSMALIQPLLRGGRMFAATQPISNAEFQLHIQEATLRALALRVVADTKTRYYTMLQAEKQINVTQQSIERDKILKDTSTGLFEGGLTTLRDVYSAEIDLSGDMATLAGNQAELRLAEYNLLDTLGLPIATTEVVLLDQDVSFQPIPLELKTWLDIALENRPEIMSIQQQIAQNALQVRVAENTVLPQLDVVAGYNRFSPNSVNSGGAFRFQLEDWTAGLLFSVPLGNVQRKSALAQAKIDQMRLQRELYQQQRVIRVEVLDAVITLRRSVAEMTSLQQKIEHSKGKLETARARFALGVANNLDISDAQKDLKSAQTDMLTAIINYNIGLAELEARIASTIQIARK